MLKSLSNINLIFIRAYAKLQITIRCLTLVNFYEVWRKNRVRYQAPRQSTLHGHVSKEIWVAERLSLAGGFVFISQQNELLTNQGFIYF